MKNAIAFALTAIVAFGCYSSGSNRGGEVTKDQGFKVSASALEFVKQGETVIVNAKVKREKDFKQDVRLQISSQQGITVSPTEALIKSTDNAEVPIHVSVGPNTAPGDYKITIKGTPERGQPVSTQFEMRVRRP